MMPLSSGRRALAIWVAWVALASPAPLARAAPPPEAHSVTGKVVQYNLTPKGEVDGLILSDGQQVHVPPSYGAALVFTVRPGDAVVVTGRAEKGGPVVEAEEIHNDGSGAVLTLRKPGEGGRKTPPLQVQGKVRFVLHTPKGEVDGAALEDGTILHVGKEPSATWLAKLAPGSIVTAEGPGRMTPMGKVIDVKKLD